MAYCSQCKGVMGPTDIACPHCGYDFPNVAVEAEHQKEGIAYSQLADVALVVSMFAAGIGCCGALLAMVFALFNGQLLVAFVYGPIAFFLQLGMLVVFLRIQKV